MMKPAKIATICFGVLSLLSTGAVETGAQIVDCSSGLLGIVASIERIDPPDLLVNVQRTPGAPTEQRKVDTCLRGGEIVTLHKNRVQKVQLFANGDFFWITAGPPHNGIYKVPESQTILEKAKSYIDAIEDLKLAIRSSPQTSRGTFVRGELDDKTPNLPPHQPLEHIRILRNLPTQQIASTAAIALSWREGTGPWKCEGLLRNMPASESLSATTSWCVLPSTKHPLTRLSVRDARGAQIGWNVITVSATVVPRPGWINQPEDRLSPADRTAWAIWVWRSAGPQWRLQAVSMLSETADKSWLAGYVFNSILNDAPLIQTVEAETP